MRTEVRPKKGLGQNFLINAAIPEKMLDFAAADPQLCAFEIGPGLGALTRVLASRLKKVVAVELDESLVPRLRENLRDFDNVEIIVGDALETDLRALAKERLGEGEFAVFGNLPYYITSPLIMGLLEKRVPASFIEVMVQKEAAERLCARLQSRECGAVTLAVRYYSEPEILFDVSPGSFYPAPKVTSSVMKLTPLKTPPVEPEDEKRMFRVIKAAFSQRRKTAANAVSSSLSIEKARVLDAIKKAGIPEAERAERISLEQYARLSDILCEA